MDLPTFLLARIAEDEEAARAATAGPWDVADNGEVYAPGFDREVRIGLSYPSRPAATVIEHLYVTCDGEGLSPSVQEGDARHIARHDPARVLADCAAKRAMIQAWPDPMGQWNAAEADAARAMKRQVLLAWARVHADHPDFDPSWR